MPTSKVVPGSILQERWPVWHDLCNMRASCQSKSIWSHIVIYGHILSYSAMYGHSQFANRESCLAYILLYAKPMPLRARYPSMAPSPFPIH